MLDATFNPDVVETIMNGSILVVEDEAIIRMALTDHLEGAGFEVLETGSGDRAIDLIKAGANVDLVITDVQMPGRNDGVALALWVKENHPHIKVIIVSGATSSAAELKALGSEGVIIPKPYSVEAVASLALNLITPNSASTGDRP